MNVGEGQKQAIPALGVSPGYPPGFQVAWGVSPALPHGRVGPSPPAHTLSGLRFLLTILGVPFPEGVQWCGQGLLGNYG